MYEISSKFTTKVIHQKVILMYLLFTLNDFIHYSNVSIVDFEQVNSDGEVSHKNNMNQKWFTH